MTDDRPRSVESQRRTRDGLQGVADAGPDPLGRAMLAHYRDEPGRLTYRDGADVRDGNVEEFYFSSPDEWDRETVECLERLSDREPILDVGCGAGKHLLWWDDRGVRTVGVDRSPNAVVTARDRCEVRGTSRRSPAEHRSTDRSSGRRGDEAAPGSREDGETTDRGLEGVLVGDMFDLPVPASAFGAVHALGTQIGLGGSLAGIRELLAEFARVTDDTGVAAIDNYDPRRLDDDFLGYRTDPREGIARRCFHLEFERPSDGTDDGSSREVGRTLQFLLCSPARLRDATVGTPWRVRDVLRSGEAAHYRAVLGKGGPTGGGRE